MIAAFVQTLKDAGIVSGALVTIGALCAGLYRLRPVKFVVQKMLVKPISTAFGAWVRKQVEDATEKHRELVKYHLGTNGKTTPIHQRLSRLETAAGLEPAKQHPEDEQ